MSALPSKILKIDQIKGGETGKACGVNINNAEFFTAVFPALPEGASAVVCSKHGDPAQGGWPAFPAAEAVGTLPTGNNNFLGCSSFNPNEDGATKARKDQFAACHFLMLDDLGTKVPLERLERLEDFELSWLLETSPGNYQGGIILAEPVTDKGLAEQLLNAVIDAGLCDKGASAPYTRWARLPVGINGKAKHQQADGAPFECRLVHWRPDARYTPAQIVEGLKLVLKQAKHSTTKTKSQSSSPLADGLEVLTLPPAENPVIAELKARGLYKTPLGSGKYDITCPWVHEHTDQLDTGTAYFEPDDNYPLGGFCCQHSHRDQYHVHELLALLGVPVSAASHKPIIRVNSGKLDLIVDAAEKVLADKGQHYQSGGVIVSVSTDPITGDPSIVPTTAPALARELAGAASWQKYNKVLKQWVPTDPPPRHVSILFDTTQFNHLPLLAGVVRQPYFRESDSQLVCQPGYDTTSRRFGVFDPNQFAVPAPTEENARAALTLLEDLISDFHFVSPADKAAALSAMFTAVVRPTLAHAPAFHVRAPVFGSGKTYLCELIGAFAGPGGNAKVSYPTTSEEATKVILSLLITSPAVVEFDDMDTDWIPHGVIKRMLTAEHITDRLLGSSKTATASTRTLFIGSGNNVGPVRDLLRRVLTIHVDPRCATPATMAYNKSPVDMVRKNRGLYVSAVLCITFLAGCLGNSVPGVSLVLILQPRCAAYH